jgi:hypothetical protein
MAPMEHCRCPSLGSLNTQIWPNLPIWNELASTMECNGPRSVWQFNTGVTQQTSLTKVYIFESISVVLVQICNFQLRPPYCYGATAFQIQGRGGKQSFPMTPTFRRPPLVHPLVVISIIIVISHLSLLPSIFLHLIHFQKLFAHSNTPWRIPN